MTEEPEEDEERPEGERSATPPRPSQAPRPSAAPRPSRPSQPPHPFRGAWRVVFAIAWIGAQGALILTAGRRPDGAFGFRMFQESSTVKVSLFREVAGESGTRTRVPVASGTWTARDAGGMQRRFAWTDRVRRRDLAVFDTEMPAAYGAAAQVARWQAALDDVATHTPDDAETRRLLLDVTVRRNGREPYVVHLASAERAGGGS